MLLNRRFFIGREVNHPLGLIDTRDRTDHPCAFGQLLPFAAFEPIDMRKTIAL